MQMFTADLFSYDILLFKTVTCDRHPTLWLITLSLTHQDLYSNVMFVYFTGSS